MGRGAHFLNALAICADESAKRDSSNEGCVGDFRCHRQFDVISNVIVSIAIKRLNVNDTKLLDTQIPPFQHLHKPFASYI